MSKKIRRQLIKIQNNASKGGGRIPSLHEALMIYERNQSNEKGKGT
jgi:hypothetical protein